MEQSPLMQLNLMLWLSWNVSTTSGFNPIFFNNGYELLWIGPPLSVPMDICIKARKAQVPFKGNPNPDLLLHKASTNAYLPIECKLKSFSPDVPSTSHSHQALQCNALLAMTGPILAGHVGVGNAARWQAHLTYVVSGGHEEQMHSTLQVLSTRLNVARIVPTSAGAIGIHIVEGDGIYLASSTASNIPIPEINDNKPTPVKVMELAVGDDPRPLYLLPYDPSIGAMDEYERQTIQERIRTALTALIGSRVADFQFEFSVDEVFRESIVVWDVWKDSATKKGLVRKTRDYILKICLALHKVGLIFERKQDVLKFTCSSAQTITDVRRYLGSKEFRQGHIDLITEPAQKDFSSIAPEFDSI